MAEKKETTEQPKAEATKALNIYQRKHEVMKVVDYVQKEEMKEGLRYRPVSRNSVIAKLRPALIAAGLDFRLTHVAEALERIVLQTRNGDKPSFLQRVHVKYRLTNVDNPEEFVEGEAIGAGIDSEDKFSGKAVTYAEKLALLKEFMIETGDEDEEKRGDPGDGPKPPATVTAEQIVEIKKLATAGKVDEAKVLTISGADSFEKIPAARYDELVSALKKRIEKQKEGDKPKA